jgi:processive 1,2-diacylglycerol beta-glucosyltransferase
MYNRVLILSTSAGAGHVKAAGAIEKAFIQSHAAREIRNVDILDYTTKVFQKIYSNLYLELVNKAPGLFGWFYDRFDKPGLYEKRRLVFDKFNARRFLNMVQEYHPDMTVCTHYLPAELISWLNEKKQLALRQAIVLTDFDVHAMWLCRQYEHYFVAIEEARIYLQRLGIPRDKSTVSGIPIDPVFSIRKDKSVMRVKHHLNPSIPTILLSAGGFGVGPVEELLAEMMHMRQKAQVVVICGKNESLKTRLDQFTDTFGPEASLAIHPVGFTTQMDEYMSAADVIVGKPGGLTTSEALAKGLAFVVVNPIQGQEERNADHLLEEGAAIRCNTLPVLAYKIDSLLTDIKKLHSLQSHARHMARPHAALDIVKKLTSLGKQT